MSAIKVCTKCQEEKPIEEFPWKSSLRGISDVVSKTCTAERSGRWYEKNKERQIEYVRNNSRIYRGRKIVHF